MTEVGEEVVDAPPVILDSDSTPTKAYKLGSWLMHYHQFYAQSERSPIWMYHPNDGVWKNNGSEYIQKWLADYLSSMFRNHLVNEVESYIRYRSYDQNVTLGGPPNKVVMENGMFNLEDFTFDTDYAPEEYHITKIPVEYKPGADCPNFKQFLKEILPSQEDRQAVCEFFGYCLFKDYPFAIILMLLGEGANGKSTLLNILRSFLGKDNVSGCEPQELAEQRFKMAELHGKLANIAGDIPAKPLKYTGTIKKLTGEDVINAERKNRDPFDFQNYAKLIFSANKLPKSYDLSNAFHRRMRIIEFPNIFSADDPNTVPQHILLRRLTNDNELSGIFNLVVQSYKKLCRDGHLTGDVTVEEKRIAYVRRSDLVEYIGLKYIDHDPVGVPLEKEVLYGLYVELCYAMDERPTNDVWFSRRLRKVCPFLDDKQTTNDEGERVRTWVGGHVDIDALNSEIDELMKIKLAKEKEREDLENQIESSGKKANKCNYDDIFETENE